MKKIKLMLDYGCSPLWWDQEDRVGNIEPNDLPLTEETIKKLNNIADRFDSLWDSEDIEIETELKYLQNLVQQELPDYGVGLHV